MLIVRYNKIYGFYDRSGQLKFVDGVTLNVEFDDEVDLKQCVKSQLFTVKRLFSARDIPDQLVLNAVEYADRLQSDFTRFFTDSVKYRQQDRTNNCSFVANETTSATVGDHQYASDDDRGALTDVLSTDAMTKLIAIAFNCIGKKITHITDYLDDINKCLTETMNHTYQNERYNNLKQKCQQTMKRIRLTDDLADYVKLSQTLMELVVTMRKPYITYGLLSILLMHTTLALNKSQNNRISVQSDVHMTVTDVYSNIALMIIVENLRQPKDEYCLNLLADICGYSADGIKPISGLDCHTTKYYLFVNKLRKVCKSELIGLIPALGLQKWKNYIRTCEKNFDLMELVVECVPNNLTPSPRCRLLSKVIEAYDTQINVKYSNRDSFTGKTLFPYALMCNENYLKVIVRYYACVFIRISKLMETEVKISLDQVLSFLYECTDYLLNKDKKIYNSIDVTYLLEIFGRHEILVKILNGMRSPDILNRVHNIVHTNGST